MEEVRPVPGTQHATPKFFVAKDLGTCKAIFLLNKRSRSSLQPYYKGPYRVLSRNDKTMVIMCQGEETLSLDNCKPAYERSKENCIWDKPEEIKQDGILGEKLCKEAIEYEGPEPEVEPEEPRRRGRPKKKPEVGIDVPHQGQEPEVEHPQPLRKRGRPRKLVEVQQDEPKAAISDPGQGPSAEPKRKRGWNKKPKVTTPQRKKTRGKPEPETEDKLLLRMIRRKRSGENEADNTWEIAPRMVREIESAELGGEEEQADEMEEDIRWGEGGKEPVPSSAQPHKSCLKAGPSKDLHINW